LTLEEKIAKLEEENFLLRKENDELKRLLQQALGKLNKNSTKPPSTDIVCIKSLRISTGKKAGGQKGYRGTTL
jgi:regulator of replication initiation timing